MIKTGCQEQLDNCKLCPCAETFTHEQKKEDSNCGNPNCVMCGNPRKTFKEKTIQEKRLEQNIDE